MLICDKGYMMRVFVYGFFIILAAVACVCLAAPQPAVVPGPDDWTVEVAFEHPQQIVVKSGTDEPSRFWYTIMTLTNNTNRDIDFYPKCELMTDTFQIIPAGRSVSKAVFEQIKSRHKSRYPFLEYLEKTDNKILQGADNAKDITVIWPDFDVRAKAVKLFIAGLSNETVAIDHPVAKDRTGRPVKVFLRKTLELTYALTSDPILRADIKLTYEAKRWVMR